MRFALTVSTLVVLTLAGCTADEPGRSTETPAPVIVSDPRDLDAGNSSGEHLHDYWGGRDRLTILDQDADDLPQGFNGGEDVPVHTYLPPAASVVPQGTLNVSVTLRWEEGDTDVYADPWLWVRTAADDAPEPVAAVASGEAVRFTVNETAWDLPHQVLSAWEFQLRVDPDPVLGFVRFQGTGHAVVEVERGLPIPLYPGHPDHWDGRDDLPLFDGSSSVAYVHDPVNGGCDGSACQQVFSPDDGIIVPPDTHHVTVTLTAETGSPTTLALQYHGADTREWKRPGPTAVEGQTQTYEILVAGDGDGPYALQSQWGFMVYNDGPVEDFGAVESYRLAATAHRNVQDAVSS